MEAGPLPILGALTMAMLYWIEMYVIEMAIEIVIFFDRVFPEFWLPNASPPILFSALGDFALSTARCQPALSELRLDPLPASGVV